MTERITELRRALQMAADRLNHCWAELESVFSQSAQTTATPN